jgi:uncharacterized membrane protein
VLGGLLSLLSAVSFAYANATVRRGVLTGTVTQAVAISLVVALPFFAVATALTGGLPLLAAFTWKSLILLALAGIIHFGWARHCNYRATKAMGANLVAPVQQYSLVLTLFLAIVWLGEALTALRILGILLVVIGPALTLRGEGNGSGEAAQSSRFQPDLAEGYFYALLSALGFGISPILIAEAFTDKGIALGIAGGFVSYVAAAAAFALPLLRPKEWRVLRSVDGVSAKWFVISGLAVGVSQMTRYMALAVAPVSVVTPINRLSLVFRLYFGARINPDHEVFGERVIWGTVISLLGAIALSVSTDDVLQGIALPDALSALLRWELRLPKW